MIKFTEAVGVYNLQSNNEKHVVYNETNLLCLTLRKKQKKLLGGSWDVESTEKMLVGY